MLKFVKSKDRKGWFNGVIKCNSQSFRDKMAVLKEKIKMERKMFMYEMTIEGLLRLANSQFVREEANWMIIEVKAFDNEPEIIINPKENFQSKLDYYAEAYNNDLTLKSNSNIKIINYDFAITIQDCL